MCLYLGNLEWWRLASVRLRDKVGILADIIRGVLKHSRRIEGFRKGRSRPVGLDAPGWIIVNFADVLVVPCTKNVNIFTLQTQRFTIKYTPTVNYLA